MGMVFFSAILPAFVLLYYIYKRDSYMPEPKSQLLKGFVFGAVSVFVDVVLIGIMSVLGLSVTDESTVASKLGTAFFLAAIPEESSKLIMLWLLLRKNKYFDEHSDGIVYAVSVGMGFAALENVTYFLNGMGNIMATGIGRSLFAVPAHFFFAVTMGYFYSLAKSDYKGRRSFYSCCTLLCPILLHGLYDSILMVGDLNIVPELIITVAVLVLMIIMAKASGKRIRRLFELDDIIFTDDELIIERRQTTKWFMMFFVAYILLLFFAALSATPMVTT
ncbi:MAG: PrsW family intramembrane metalloprotease [Bacteroidaceae bacterium]|nr:PrsW family intramembrane metalloprotease [Bacteroidaceae bacterium]